MKLKSKKQNIWFTADTHYWHNNLTKSVSRWSDKTECRDFESVANMSIHMVNQINEYVKEDDILFFLGDWSFGGISNVWNFRRQLNVKTIHFIIGNHDHHIEFQNHELPNVRRAAPYSTEFEHFKPVGGEYPDYLFGKDLFTSVQHYLKISVDGQIIVMSHYPILSWDSAYEGSYMLHGHTHGTLFASPATQWAGSAHWYHSSKILDVGMDAIFKTTGEYKPISFQEVRKIMNQKTVVFTDHHENPAQE